MNSKNLELDLQNHPQSNNNWSVGDGQDTITSTWDWTFLILLVSMNLYRICEELIGKRKSFMQNKIDRY